MTNPWTDALTREQLNARYALTAKIDPRFAAEDRKFWESRTLTQLSSLKSGAWYANESTTYQMANSYLTLNR